MEHVPETENAINFNVRIPPLKSINYTASADFHASSQVGAEQSVLNLSAVPSTIKWASIAAEPPINAYLVIANSMMARSIIG
jgi:hypothetical protein